MSSPAPSPRPVRPRPPTSGRCRPSSSISTPATSAPSSSTWSGTSASRPWSWKAAAGRSRARTKLHVWWKLNEPAEGEDIATLCRLRGDIAVKVGGDTHFRSAHQPIRVAGSVYHKGGFQRLVAIRHHRAHVEVDLGEFAEAVEAMPALPGVGMEPGPTSEKPSIADVLTTPVREAGEDAWTRFQGASAAIGHYIRLVHDGRMTATTAGRPSASTTPPCCARPGRWSG